MKIYKSKPRYHWVSPYTILEKIVFWREIDYDEPAIKFWNSVLEPISTVWQKFLDVVHPEINYVKIDHYDVWSMDNTLSPIILPMLIELQRVKHGAPCVDDEDVPANLRSTTKSAQRAKKKTWDTDGNHFKRWDWVLDEMIWAFTQLCDENHDAEFFTGKSDIVWVPAKLDAAGKPITYELKHGPNHTMKYDKQGAVKHYARISNGTRLFGKYYQSLWD